MCAEPYARHSAPVPPRRINNLPILKRRFIGRHTILTELHTKMTSALSPTSTPRVVVLSGNGGTGKSRIALEYARRHWANRYYESVSWIDAAYQDAVLEGLAQIGVMVDPTAETLVKESQINRALRFFSTTERRWLIVMDNYDRVDSYRLEPLIPRGESGYVIITTRNQQVPADAFIPVGSMSEEDAMALFLDRCETERYSIPDATPEQVLKLIRELGALPLAVDQAVAYLISTRQTLEGFLTYYRQHRKSVLKLAQVVLEYYKRVGIQSEMQPVGVYATWDLSFEVLENPDEKQSPRNRQVSIKGAHILELSAFLDRTNISEALFDSFKSILTLSTKTPSRKPSAKLNEAIRLLNTWSLIDGLGQDKNGLVFMLHPLVSEWARLRRKKVVRKQLLIEAIQILDFHLKCDHEDVMSSPIEVKRAIVRHLDALVQNDNDFQLQSQGFEDPETKNNDDSHNDILSQRLGKGVLLQVAVRFASFYYDMGHVDKAESLYQQILDLNKDSNDDEIGIFEAKEGLSIVRIWQDRYPEAYQLCKESLEANRRQWGNIHPSTLRSMHNLGEIQNARKEFQNAIELFKECVSGFSQDKGPDHFETLREKEALGNAYRASGNYDAAEPLIHEAKTKLQEQLGELSYLTLCATESYALLQKALGKYDKAVELFEVAIKGYKKTLGIEQYGTLGAMAGLADTMRKMDRFSDAANLYKEIMRYRKEMYSLGENSPSYLRAKAAFEEVISVHPTHGDVDTFSYPWTRPVYAFDLSSSEPRRKISARAWSQQLLETVRGVATNT